jgi:ABC-type lipoprotein export system ATPase subunit
MIALRELDKTYRSRRREVRALRNIELEIRTGEFAVIRGPSGCGKTTLLLALGGMLRPTRGAVVVDNRDLYALSTRERALFRANRIGFVFQMFHLVPYLTVLENIQLALSGPADNQDVSRGQSLLAELGLSSRSTHLPEELSAGERQRAAVARALYHRPDFLLADEPTGNLDPENAGEVFRHLDAFNRRGGTVVVVTHGSGADPFADRVLYLRDGALVS